MGKSDKNLIIVTAGKEDRGSKATIGFCLGSSSVALGIDTTIFLTLQGTIWGMDGLEKNISIDGFEPLQTYIQQFIEGGGKLLVCSPCVKFFCGMKQGSAAKLIDGAEYAGFTTIAHLMSDCSVAVF